MEEDDSQEYEVEKFLYLITFPATGDEPERHFFCVNWSKHEVDISWIVGNDLDIVKELRGEESFWIENPPDENEDDVTQERNGKLPPYDFCYNEKTDEPLPGFPLELSPDYLIQWKREWKNPRQRRQTKDCARRRVEEDAFVVPDDDDGGANVQEVAEDLNEEAAEEVVFVADEAVEEDIFLAGKKRHRPPAEEAEEERLAAYQTQEFLDEEAKGALRAEILTEIAERCSSEFDYDLLIWDQNSNGEYLVIGYGICKNCLSRVLCWKKEGIFVHSFDDWSQKVRRNVFRPGAFRDHRCRSGGGKEGSRSKRLEKKRFTPADVTELIALRYGHFLQRLNPQIFQKTAYITRHVSAATTLVPVMVSIPSFWTRLKVPFCCLSIVFASLI